MKKTLKAMVSVLMAVVISVTSLCTMASAQVSISDLPKSYYNWEAIEKAVLNGGDYEKYISEEATGVGNQLIRRVVTLDNMFDRDIVCDRDLKKVKGADKYTHGDVVKCTLSSLHWLLNESANGTFNYELFTYADLVWYLKTYCGYTDKQCEVFKDEAVEYILNAINPLFDSLNNYYSKSLAKTYSPTGYVTRHYTKEEAEKYWDKIVLVFDEAPCTYTNVALSAGGTTRKFGYKAHYKLVNVLDMNDNQVYYDLAGRGITKADVMSGNLATGYYLETSTENAQKVMNGEKVTTPSTDTKPTVATRKAAKTLLNKVKAGLNGGTVKMSNAEYKKLRTLYKAVDMPASVVKGKTFNKNLKIALIQKLNYALPYMTAKQVSSLRSQLKAILA